MNPRLKQIIKNKLSEDLSSVSIIDFNDSIWFIDAKSKYWYLELYKKTKTLWWRLDFFEDFFILFGMEQREFVPIIIEWVEEVLNSRVYITKVWRGIDNHGVEEVLNSRVNKTISVQWYLGNRAEEVLNSRVNTTPCVSGELQEKVDEVLNSRVLRTQVALHSTSVMAEGVLNCGGTVPTIGERLNHKVSQAKEGELFDETIVDTVLSSLRSF